MGDNATVEADAYGFMGNEYRKIFPTSKRIVFCDLMQKDTAVYPDILKGSNLPPQTPDMCPLPPNHYTIKDYMLNIDTSNYPLPPLIKKLKLDTRVRYGEKNCT